MASSPAIRLPDDPGLRLLGPGDPPPVEHHHYGARWPALIVCDHASRAVPRALGNLGLEDAQLARHIGWDIGAAALAHALARRLELPLVQSGYSRLVIDCNRRLDDPTSIAVESDGQPIPGNVGLTDADRAARARELFGPYHAGIDAELRSAVARCPRDHVPHGPALIAVHSFTDVYGGRERPWHCGILWDRDPRLPLALLEALRDERGLVVGDNEPYSGRHPADFTIDHHAEHRGWPHVCIEVRQDLIAGPAGVEAWARRLATPLADRLSDPNLYRAMQY
ncbi:MAG: N-formylglutamate amidohydrolase [Steroidobacteraceae bacterium]